MDWAALISWIVTAGGGFVLLGLWLRHGLLAVTTVATGRARGLRVLLLIVLLGRVVGLAVL